jgi:hypothetical protein
MAFKLIDRAKETASAGGDGDFTLGGTGSPGFQAFVTKLTADGDTTMYGAEQGGDWETGTLTRVDATTYSRTVLDNSAGTTAAIDFASAPTVYSTVPAAALDFVGGPCFRVHRVGAQYITSGVWSKVELNTVDWNYGGAFDAVTDHRFMPQGDAGIYEFKAHVYCKGGGSGAGVVCGIYKNGTLHGQGSYTPSQSGGIDGGSTAFDEVFLNGSTDYVELFVFAAAATPSLGRNPHETYFIGSLKRRAE